MVRDLYNYLHEPDYNDFAYENLELQVQSPTLSKKQGNGGSSRCRFGDSRIAIVEETAEILVDDFVRRVSTICRAFAKVCDDKHNGAPPVILQRCRIRCLAQPHESSNALDLLAGKVANVIDRIDPFGRPPAFFGVRFRFPPARIPSNDVGDDEEDDVEYGDFSTVRFETYSEDPSKVWMEIASTSFFPALLDLSGDDIGQVESGVRKAYAFVSDNCKRFLDQFDDAESDDSEPGERDDDEANA